MFDEEDYEAIREVNWARSLTACDPNCSTCNVVGRAFRHMDLSPLARFVDQETGPPCFCGTGSFTWSSAGVKKAYHGAICETVRKVRPADEAARDAFFKAGTFAKYMVTAENTGEPFDDLADLKYTYFGPIWGGPLPTEPKPEPSPQEKALDEFIETRKAKRAIKPAVNEPGQPDRTYRKGMDAVHRAMSMAAPHSTCFAERLNPYRGAEL